MKIKIDTEVAHVTRDSDTSHHFQAVLELQGGSEGARHP